MHHKSIVIEPQPRADVPAGQPHLIPHVGRRFDVPAVIRKLKLQLRSRIEESRIRYGILQCFAHRAKNAVHACFPVVMSVMPGEVRAQIAFAIAAVLRNNHRSGRRVRAQRCARIPHASGKTQKQVLRERMLIINLPARFGVGKVLPLPCDLLHQFVRHEKPHRVVRYRDAQAIAI